MLAIIEDIENEDKKSILSDWYKKYNRIMRKKAYYIIGDYHTANDMVNEAFIKIIQNFEKINKLNCHARSYYFVITIRSVCIDYLRKNKIKSKYLDDTSQKNRLAILICQKKDILMNLKKVKCILI